MAISGHSCLIVLAASSPSVPWVGGIRMSTTARSGCSSRTASSSSLASPAWPTTSKPDRPSRLASPSRSRTSSSATTTRTAFIPMILPSSVPDRRQGGEVAEVALPSRPGRQTPRATLSGMIPIARPKLEGNVAVGDDRQLGFAEFGDPQGRAVFWLHGTPGARRQIPTEARVYAELTHIRLIGVDRPGIGSSTPFQYPNVLAFADDLRTIADVLGIDQMAVIGLSGGGPYTLACAAAMSDRIVLAGVLGGVAPSVGPDAIGGGVMALASTVAGCRRRDPTVAARGPSRAAAVRQAFSRGRPAAAGAARVQCDVPRRPTQRQPQTAVRAVRRRHRLRKGLGFPARRGQGAGALVARRQGPHRAVRARPTRRLPAARRRAVPPARREPSGRPRPRRGDPRQHDGSVERTRREVTT